MEKGRLGEKEGRKKMRIRTYTVGKTYVNENYKNKIKKVIT